MSKFIVLKLMCILCTLIMLSQCKNDYCQMICFVTAKVHSICENKCKVQSHVVMYQPDFAFRNACLFWHNSMRNQLGKGEITSGGHTEAADMNALNYDLGIEFVMMCWLAQGKEGFDPCAITDLFGDLWQNRLTAVADDIITHKDLMYKHVMEKWFTETTKPNFENAMRAGFTHMGCARSSFKIPTKRRPIKVLMCGYSYVDDIDAFGTPLYTKGPGASKCGFGRKKNTQMSGLCGEVIWTEELKAENNPEFEEFQGRGGSTGGNGGGKGGGKGSEGGSRKKNGSSTLECCSILYLLILIDWLVILRFYSV